MTERRTEKKNEFGSENEGRVRETMAAQPDADAIKTLEMRVKAAEARATTAEAQVKAVLASLNSNHNVGTPSVPSGSNQWQSSGDKMFVVELRLQRDAAQVSWAVCSRMTRLVGHKESFVSHWRMIHIHASHTYSCLYFPIRILLLAFTHVSLLCGMLHVGGSVSAANVTRRRARGAYPACTGLH